MATNPNEDSIKEEIDEHNSSSESFSSLSDYKKFKSEEVDIQKKNSADDSDHDDNKSNTIRKERHPTCQFKSDKKWIDCQYDDLEETSIKKPDEIENEMADPPVNYSEEILDRIQGSIFGMALGDALGAHVEFRPRQYLSDHPVEDLQGGGTWGLQKGQFTDDTSMALCLANSLIGRRGFNSYDQLVRYRWWHIHGYMSSTGKCFDIGAATSRSLGEFAHRQKIFAEENSIPIEDLDFLDDLTLLNKFDTFCSEKGVAGNGALMRLAPVPLFFYKNPPQAVEFSGISGQITHGDQKAYDACRYYGALIVAALHGETKEQLLDPDFYLNHQHWFNGKTLHPDIMNILQGSFRRQGGYDDGIRGKGYIVDALQAALWAFWSDDNSFKKGVLQAVNLGDDADTTAAIYGQLAGAFYGYHSLPQQWIEQIYANKFLATLSKWIAYQSQTEHTNITITPQHLHSLDSSITEPTTSPDFNLQHNPIIKPTTPTSLHSQNNRSVKSISDEDVYSQHNSTTKATSLKHDNSQDNTTTKPIGSGDVTVEDHGRVTPAATLYNVKSQDNRKREVITPVKVNPEENARKTSIIRDNTAPIESTRNDGRTLDDENMTSSSTHHNVKWQSDRNPIRSTFDDTGSAEKQKVSPTTPDSVSTSSSFLTSSPYSRNRNNEPFDFATNNSQRISVGEPAYGSESYRSNPTYYSPSINKQSPTMSKTIEIRTDIRNDNAEKTSVGSRPFQDQSTLHYSSTNKPFDPHKNLLLWTVNDVCQWVQSFGGNYSTYVPSFRKDFIDGFRLYNFVNNQILIDYGMRNDNHRQNILHAIEQIRRDFINERRRYPYF